MSTPSPDSLRGRRHRLVVALVIASAAAAVTAGVVLNERHPGEAAVQRVEAAPVQTMRERWRDPWQRPGRLSESAPASLHEWAQGEGAPPADPSLPAAARAFDGAPAAAGEAAATF